MLYKKFERHVSKHSVFQYILAQMYRIGILILFQKSNDVTDDVSEIHLILFNTFSYRTSINQIVSISSILANRLN